jgi:hypothetical protein
MGIEIDSPKVTSAMASRNADRQPRNATRKLLNLGDNRTFRDR